MDGIHCLPEPVRNGFILQMGCSAHEEAAVSRPHLGHELSALRTP